jgi:hypothetical protein
MDDILANLESYGEQAARLAGQDQLYYALLLQDTLQQVTAHLPPLEKSLVMRAAVQTLGNAADTSQAEPASASASLLHSEHELIPLKLD